jgi:hypothetical protein
MGGGGMNDQQTLTEAAEWYAGAGIPVHPLWAGTKDPATTHGVLDATTDPKLIKKWWKRNPKYNIGLACGVIFDVLDVDVKNDSPGMESIKKLWRAGLLRGAYGKACTPSGGMHLLFAPGGDGNHADTKAGLDFRGKGGYIVAAPSTTDLGRYWWVAVHSERKGEPFDWHAAHRALHGDDQARRPFVPRNGIAPDGAGLIRTILEAQVGNHHPAIRWACYRASDDGILDQLEPDILAAADAIGYGRKHARAVIKSLRKSKA